jgi:hypothetical protein
MKEMERIQIDGFNQSSGSSAASSRGWCAVASLGLAVNAIALAIGWSADLIKIETDATIRLPFGLAIPVMREQSTFSLFASLTEFYHAGQVVVFVIIAVCGVIVPAAKLLLSALLLLWSKTSTARALLHSIQAIGRWAMLDVFGLAILTVTLKLGDSVNVTFCDGFYWFAAAALLPMLNGIVIEKILLDQSERLKERERSRRSSLAFLILLAAASLLMSCSHRGGDFFFVVDDLRGTKTGTEVLWRGAQVGRVSDVRFENGHFRVEVRLHPEYRNQIRSDATVAIAKGITTAFKPVVKINGGQDSAAAPMQRGMQLQESHSLLDVASVKQWVGSTAPDLRRELEDLLARAKSPEAEQLRKKIELDLEKVRGAIERGESTIADAQRRIRNAIDAAMKELAREGEEHPTNDKAQRQQPSK